MCSSDLTWDRDTHFVNTNKLSRPTRCNWKHRRILTAILTYGSCSISAMFALLSYTSFWLHHCRLGRIEISEPETLFLLASLAFSSISVLFVFSVLPAPEDIAWLLNTLIQICATFERHVRPQMTASYWGRHTPTSWCDILFVCTLASNAGIVLAVGLIYLPSCELHFFHVLLPNLACSACPLIRLVLAVVQTLIMAHYVCVMNLVVAFVYPSWFFLPTMMKELR